MEPIKFYTPSKKTVNRDFIQAVVMIVLGLIIIPYLIGMGVLFIILGFYHTSAQIIKIYDEHIELKFAPLAAAKYIKYTDISEIERISDKKIFIHYLDAEKPKKLRVPVHMLEQDDLIEFLDILEKNTKMIKG